MPPNLTGSECPEEFRAGELLPEQVVRHWLGACGMRPRIYKGARIVDPKNVRIGDHVQIDESVHLFAGQGITIGSYVHLAFLSSISGGGECVIGDFVGIGAGVRIVTGSERVDQGGLTNPTAPPELRTVERKKVIIHPHAVIFTNAVVMPGVTIGEGAVVAATSVVHHDLKPWTIYAGQPLVAVGRRDPGPVLDKAARLRDPVISNQWK